MESALKSNKKSYAYILTHIHTHKHSLNHSLTGTPVVFFNFVLSYVF